MKIAVCLDDNNGMLFNHRRQSQDRAVRTRLLSLVRRGRLWMNAYSAEQFAGQEEHIKVSEQFLEEAGRETWCFVENQDVSPYEERITEIVIYRWNRSYPGDFFFPLDLKQWKLESSIEFHGFSHEKLTEERYVR